VAGIVCLRPLSEGVCEMKRLFVRPPWLGKGIGRSLARAIINEGRKAGYGIMKLDTLERLVAAESLYKSLGFARTGAYCVNPEDDVIYMSLDL
ncbi:MAG TPA: GNAT family N-acetyltransferase, partial [Rhodospirillales bacterium]|nr:GNAT family N-acetyltransferase [Rhodospirillales bacterium]